MRLCLRTVLPLSPEESRFLDLLLDRGTIYASLLTEDSDLKQRINRHPLLMWKARNAVNIEADNPADKVLSLYRAITCRPAAITLSIEKTLRPFIAYTSTLGRAGESSPIVKVRERGSSGLTLDVS